MLFPTEGSTIHFRVEKKKKETHWWAYFAEILDIDMTMVTFRKKKNQTAMYEDS